MTEPAYPAMGLSSSAGSRPPSSSGDEEGPPYWPEPGQIVRIKRGAASSVYSGDVLLLVSALRVGINRPWAWLTGTEVDPEQMSPIPGERSILVRLTYVCLEEEGGNRQ